MSMFSQIKIISPRGVFTIPWSERIQGQELKLTGKFPPETMNIIFAVCYGSETPFVFNYETKAQSTAFCEFS